MEVVFQLIVNGLLTAAIYALIAAGVSFLYATSRIFHLAHGVVIIGAGYSFWWMWTVLGWHIILAILFALLISVFLGWLMNEFVYEPLRKKGIRGLGYLIATLALLTMGVGVLQLLFGSTVRTFPFKGTVFELGLVRITPTQIWILGVAVILLGLFLWITRATKIGKAMRATADNEEVAEVLGIDTKKIRRTAFVLSSLLAAAAGILVGLEFNLEPNMGILLVIKGFAAAVIGGVGSLGGAVLGSLIIGLLEQGAAWFWGGGIRDAVTFIILFLFLLIKPSGLFGKRTRT